jgi:hypothetical protein
VSEQAPLLAKFGDLPLFILPIEGKAPAHHFYLFWQKKHGVTSF